MKKFLQDIAFGLCLIIIVWGAYELIYSRTTKSSYSYKYQYVQTHRNDIKVLLMGNSHMENGVNPYLMGDSIFNFASSGRWIYYDDLLIQEFVPQMQNLKMIILALGYAIPLTNYHNHEIKDMAPQYIYFYANQMHKFYDVFPDNIIHSSALLSGVDILSPYVPQCDSLGYDPSLGQSDDWKNIHNVKKTMISDDKKFSQDTLECKEHILNIAKICYQHNVQLIVITTPCSNYYLENVTEEGLKMTRDIIQRVQKCYPIEYRSYLSDSDFRADSLYFNSSHLNSIGTDLFSLKLARDIGLIK
ncbi:MAG: hypothetical protein MJZ84_04280 [Paludibacteraceae bacterium]|nr:hypothetical protein [Paludibacteraceae bacterium]